MTIRGSWVVGFGLWGGAAVLCVGLAVNVGAASPTATAPATATAPVEAKGKTRHDFLREHVDFQRRLFAGQYLAVGKRDPKWDAQALEFLEAMAIHLTYTNEDAVYTVVEPPTFEQLLELGQAAADAGCDDPLVTYFRGVDLMMMGRYDDAGPLVMSSVDGLVRRKYHPRLVSMAAGNLAPLPTPNWDTVAAGGYALMSWENLMATFAGRITDADARYFLDTMGGRFDDQPLARKLEFCKRIAASANANPWLVNLFYGKYEIKAAWGARGTGFANTVTEKGWQDFYAHLGKARDYLMKAHALHPEFPEAATEMITVAMGAGSRLNERPRDWFDRAVRAQVDYQRAYDTYLMTILPRWGGSYEKMLDFGLECMAGGRYDTCVPTELLRVLERIDTDGGSHFTIYSTPATRQILQKLFAEVARRRPATSGGRDYYGSYHVALEWRTGHFREAGQLLERLGDRIDHTAFTRVHAWAPLAVGEVHAMNSTEAATIERAGRLAAAGDAEGAVRAYDEASSKLAKDDPGQFFLHYRARAMGIESEFKRGDWVWLNAGADHAPWSVGAGKWQMGKDGSFVGTGDKYGRAALICRADFGKQYEVKAKVDFPDAGRRGVGAILLNWSGPIHYQPAGINGVTSKVFVTSSQTQEQAMQLTGGEELTLRVKDRTFDVLVDGAVIFADRPLWKPAGDEAFLAIGLNGSVANRVVKFSDVQVRRLDAVGGN